MRQRSSSQAQSNTSRQSGFTLVELIVSLGLLSLVGLSLVSYSSSALNTMAVESKASLYSLELQNAAQLISTELRMSSSISPYLVGNSATTVTCESALSVNATSLKFLVVQDEDSASTAGIQPYYVGYRYDPATQELLRGEIAGSSISNCALPAGDPTSNNIATILAQNVTQIDSNADGIVDPVFEVNGNSIKINLGIQASGPNGTSISQAMPFEVYRRTS